MLRFLGSQRVGHDWATELNWTQLNRIRNSPYLPPSSLWQPPSYPLLLHFIILYTSYKWHYLVFVLLRLAYSTYVLPFHLHCHKWQDFLLSSFFWRLNNILQNVQLTLEQHVCELPGSTYTHLLFFFPKSNVHYLWLVESEHANLGNGQLTVKLCGISNC